MYKKTIGNWGYILFCIILSIGAGLISKFAGLTEHQFIFALVIWLFLLVWVFYKVDKKIKARKVNNEL